MRWCSQRWRCRSGTATDRESGACGARLNGPTPNVISEREHQPVRPEWLKCGSMPDALPTAFFEYSQPWPVDGARMPRTYSYRRPSFAGRFTIVCHVESAISRSIERGSDGDGGAADGRRITTTAPSADRTSSV